MPGLLNKDFVAGSGGPALLLAVSVIAAGCGTVHARKLSEGSQQPARPAASGLGKAAAPPPIRCTTAATAVGSNRSAFAAIVVRRATVRNHPGAGHVVARLGPRDLNGLATVIAVEGVRSDRTCRPAWYHVKLSTLPNGSSGWIGSEAVRVYRVKSRIVVSLSRRTLKLYRSGKLVLETTVGIGASATPTPTGRFFVNERYALTSPNGPFGPYALGISAHSVALQHVWVEHGPIALHGTNEPWSIGEAASNGCIHVPNDVMGRVFRNAVDGTPVVIQA